MKTLERASGIAGIIGTIFAIIWGIWTYLKPPEPSTPTHTIDQTVSGTQNVIIHGDNNVIGSPPVPPVSTLRNVQGGPVVKPHAPISQHISNSPGSINTIGQIGSNTVVNQAPVPKLIQLQPSEGVTPQPVQEENGLYKYTYLFEWTAQFPDTWRIVACGNGVQDIKIIAPVTGHAGVRGACAFADLRNPIGKYYVQVFSSQKTALQIQSGVPDNQLPLAGERLGRFGFGN